MDSGARDSDGIGNFFPEGATDEAAARLLTALQSGPGHALVIGAHTADVDAVFSKVDGQLTCHRRLRISGAGLDAEGVVSALGADLASADPPPSAVSILTTLATQARAAGTPIVVVIAQAEEAGPVALERLCALIDEVPEARATVRIVLLGGPRLSRILADSGARRLWARFQTTVQAPPCERSVLDAPPVSVGERRARRWGAGVGVAAAATVVALLVGSVRHWGAPPTAPNDDPAVVASEPPGNVAAKPPAPVAPERPAAVASEPRPAVAPEPPVVVARQPESAQQREPEKQRDVAAPTQVARRSDVAPAPVARPTPEPAAPTPPSMLAPARGEILQLGAFRSAENAQALREQAARLFPDAQVSDVTLHGVAYHRVRLGAANERDLAARAAALKAAGFPTVRVRD